MRAVPVILAFSFLAACAGLPRIQPVPEGEKAGMEKKCAAPFLKAPWRLVHSIDGTLPGGATAAMIGITMAWPDTGRLHCTLMSIEGLVLLDAEYDGKLVVNRGIGPLASPDLVMGMIRDIRLILFRPAGTMAEAGTLGDGSPVCRYRSGSGVADVVTGKEAVEIHTYGGASGLERSVRFFDFRGDGMPGKIELESRGAFGYTLRLDLLEAERVR
jgi:hypothetical protein